MMKNPFEGFSTLQYVFLFFLLLLLVQGLSYIILHKLLEKERKKQEGFEAVPTIQQVKFGINIPLPKPLDPIDIPIAKPGDKSVFNEAIRGFNKAIIDPINHTVDRILLFSSNIKGSFYEIGEGAKTEWFTIQLLFDCVASKLVSFFPCLLIYVIQLFSEIIHAIGRFFMWLFGKAGMDMSWVFPIIDLLIDLVNGIVYPLTGFKINEWPPVIEAVCFKCTKKPTVDASYFTKCVVEGSLGGSAMCYLNQNQDGKPVIPISRLTPTNVKSFKQVANAIIDDNNPENGIHKIQSGFKRFGSAWSVLNANSRYRNSDVDKALADLKKPM